MSIYWNVQLNNTLVRREAERLDFDLELADLMAQGDPLFDQHQQDKDNRMAELQVIIDEITWAIYLFS